MTPEEIEQRFAKGIEMFEQGLSQPTEPGLKFEACGWKHANLAQTQFRISLKIGNRVRRKKGANTEGKILDFWRSQGNLTLNRSLVEQKIKARVRWDNDRTSKVNLNNLIKC